VDWFGFMAYDLHGSWDSDTATLGSLVRGQTDIREIYNDTLPLWFDGLNPSKINFGLALYGRGYTLSDPGCNQLLCPFAGPSDPGPCTNYAGMCHQFTPRCHIVPCCQSEAKKTLAGQCFCRLRRY
jgi:chitinase